MRCYQFLLASAYTTVSHAYVGSCNSYFLPPLLTLYKILLYIDVPYFKIGVSTVKTVPKFEFIGSNLLRDKPQADCLLGCGKQIVHHTYSVPRLQYIVRKILAFGTLCWHNFEHNRYVQASRNSASIIGSLTVWYIL